MTETPSTPGTAAGAWCTATARKPCTTATTGPLTASVCAARAPPGATDGSKATGHAPTPTGGRSAGTLLSRRRCGCGTRPAPTGRGSTCLMTSTDSRRGRGRCCTRPPTERSTLPMATDRALTVEKFPSDLRRKLRMYAAERDTTMRQLLITAAENHCDFLAYGRPEGAATGEARTNAAEPG